MSSGSGKKSVCMQAVLELLVSQQSWICSAPRMPLQRPAGPESYGLLLLYRPYSEALLFTIFHLCQLLHTWVVHGQHILEGWLGPWRSSLQQRLKNEQGPQDSICPRTFVVYSELICEPLTPAITSVSQAA